MKEKERNLAKLGPSVITRDDSRDRERATQGVRPSTEIGEKRRVLWLLNSRRTATNTIKGAKCPVKGGK